MKINNNIMQFINLHNDGRGSSHAPIVLDNIKDHFTGILQFENFHSFECRIVEDKGKDRLDIKWTHYVTLNGGEVYRFHIYMVCVIEQKNILATEEQCGELIDISHEDLRKEWENYRQQDVNFFPSILPLSIEQKPLFVSHLMRKLNEL